jgi:hypothetical protein
MTGAGAPATDRYACFDFTLRSEIPLPELRPAEGDGAQVEIRVGAVPEILPGAPAPVHGLQVAGEDAMFCAPGVARYLMRGGREIVVAPMPGGSQRNLRVFLLGSALGILCHQRGLLLLHANAIVSDGAAFAFAGASGAGKSTLAAHFERAGYAVLCDDVCGVSFDSAGRPLAWPGVPRLKLWGDAAEAFGHERGTLDLAIEGLDKYHVPLAARSRREPAPLARLYVLGRAAEGAAGAISRLHGAQAMGAVLEQSYRGQYLAPLGLAQRHFGQCAALLAQVEVYAASRAWGYDLFEREAARLERHIHSG